MKTYTKRLVTLAVLSLFTTYTAQAQVEFIVNSTHDIGDLNIGDGNCDTGNSLPYSPFDTECTLRAAIQELEALPALAGNSIIFDISTEDDNHSSGVWTISPASAYPVIDFPVEISTTNQTGVLCQNYVLSINTSVIVDGVGTPAGTDGFTLSGDHEQTLEGLSIVNFPRDGIAVSGTAVKNIRCNFIGIAGDGTTVMPNGDDGIDFANFVDGTVVHVNIISGNTDNGIEHAVTLTSDETWIHSNVIGLDETSEVDKGNGGSGIAMFGTKALSIGVGPPSLNGNDPSDLGLSTGNYIGGNGGSGIAFGNSGGSTNNVIRNNFIGVGIDPDIALPNDLHGIILGNGHDDNIIRNNIISANTRRGISIGASDNNSIMFNDIGTNSSGNDMGNGEEGIFIGFQADDNTVTGNDIAFNSIGVWMTSGSGVLNQGFQNEITDNRIFKNDGMGIDIEPVGPNANDADDADEGSNNNQNSPEITEVELNFFQGGSMEVTYNVDSAPTNSTYPIAVEFYLADDSNDEAAILLGVDTYTETDYNSLALAGGSKTVTLSPFVVVVSSNYIGATATDADGNTSEISLTPADISLPVELAGFSAFAQGGDIVLNWQTISERNNAGFEVQILDGNEFQPLAFVEGAGTSVEIQKYTFTLSDVLPGLHSFRLKQVDFDGSFAYSSIIEAVAELPVEYVMESAYPNPFNPTTQISFAVANTQQVDAVLYSTLGEQVRNLYSGEVQGNVMQSFEVNADGLPTGSYFVRLKGETFQAHQKIVLVK